MVVAIPWPTFGLCLLFGADEFIFLLGCYHWRLLGEDVGQYGDKIHESRFLACRIYQ
jgi:hypothetical protein